MLPNFLVIGAARSASTWIHECLKEHPDVYVPPRTKELHFFNRPSNYAKGLEWYERFFDETRSQHAVGEVTPTYLCQPGTAEKIHTHLPEVRLVASLRNPVDRAYSAYVGQINSGRARPGEDLFAASARLHFDNQSSILEHGRYHSLLEDYLRYFDRDRLLILIYEDIKKDPVGFIRNIYRHIGVDANHEPSVLATPQNPTQFSDAVRFTNRLNELFLRPVSTRLSEAVRRSVIRARRRFVPAYYPPMEADLRRRLADYYREDTRKLSELLGRDLAEWSWRVA